MVNLRIPADDIVILIDAHPRHDWLLGAVKKRLREEFAKLRVEINEEKSRNAHQYTQRPAKNGAQRGGTHEARKSIVGGGAPVA